MFVLHELTHNIIVYFVGKHCVLGCRNDRYSKAGLTAGRTTLTCLCFGWQEVATVASSIMVAALVWVLMPLE